MGFISFGTLAHARPGRLLYACIHFLSFFSFPPQHDSIVLIVCSGMLGRLIYAWGNDSTFYFVFEHDLPLILWVQPVFAR